MNLTNFLPFDNYTLVTHLSGTEVRSRIANAIEPRKRFQFTWFAKPAKPYQGYSEGDVFEMSRVINYRNSFLPSIKGHIYENFGTTEIVVKMRPVGFVLVSM